MRDCVEWLWLDLLLSLQSKLCSENWKPLMKKEFDQVAHTAGALAQS